MPPSREVFREKVSLKDLPKAAGEILALLLSRKPFCAFLQAKMGSGKTTLVSHMLRQHGLCEKTPVVSPTYTIVNDYEIGGDWFAHMDFYRAGDYFSLSDLGVLDCREYRGMFVEWPEVPSLEDALEPTHVITLSFVSENEREIVVEQV